MNKKDEKKKNAEAKAKTENKNKSVAAAPVANKKSATAAAPEQSSVLDSILWIVVVIGLCSSVGLNYYFTQPESLLPITTRLPIVIGCIVVAIVCALCTSTGRRIIKFARSSKAEMRRVTWPTKDETIKSTVGVAVVAIIVAFLLWVFDVVIGFFVSLITNA